MLARGPSEKSQLKLKGLAFGQQLISGETSSLPRLETHASWNRAASVMAKATAVVWATSAADVRQQYLDGVARLYADCIVTLRGETLCRLASAPGWLIPAQAKPRAEASAQ